MRIVSQASLAAFASIGLLTASAEAQTRRAPAAAGPAVTPERAALLSTQPIGVDMAHTALGWIKACPVAAEPRNCSVTGAFALAADQPPNLRVTIGPSSQNGTRPLAITLPIDVALRPGFTIALGNGQAVLGDYRTCGATGCSGEVALSNALYQQLLLDKRLSILIGNAADKPLRLNVALEDFAKTASGLATPEAEIVKRRQADAEARKIAATAPQPSADAAPRR